MILGCEESTQVAVWEDDEDEFYNCPRKFITESVIDFYDELSVYKEIPGSSPKFENFSNKFLEGFKYYTQQYNRFYSAKLKEKKQKPLAESFGYGRHTGKSKSDT